MSITLKVKQLDNVQMALSNCIFLNKIDIAKLKGNDKSTVTFAQIDKKFITLLKNIIMQNLGV